MAATTCPSRNARRSVRSHFGWVLCIALAHGCGGDGKDGSDVSPLSGSGSDAGAGSSVAGGSSNTGGPGVSSTAGGGSSNTSSGSGTSGSGTSGSGTSGSGTSGSSTGSVSDGGVSGGGDSGSGRGDSGSSGGGDGGSGGMPATGPKLKPTTDVTMDGPYPTTVNQNVNSNAGWLFRPTTLGEGGVKHPILVWGCGSTSMPSAYMFHLSRVASHGFVVYASTSSSVTPEMLTKGIDWLFAENARSGSDLNQKLDLKNVAVGGHSLGSLSTYDVAKDPRITTTIHVDGGSFDGTGGAKLIKPTVFICGESSIAAENCDTDYKDVKVPIFFTKIKGLSGLDGHIQAARQGIDVWVAWMRWQMAGETERRKDFVDPSCTFCTGKYISQSKNW